MSVLTSQHTISKAEQQFLPSRPAPIRNSAGRVVGTVRTIGGRCALVKSAVPRRHMLWHPRAWACDKVALDQAARAGADWVCIHERGSRRRWWATIAAFAAYGFELERGCGRQVGLVLERWSTEDAAGPLQLPLFAEVAP